MTRRRKSDELAFALAACHAELPGELLHRVAGFEQPIDVGGLYKKCAELAESEALPFAKSAQGFGRHLTNMKRVIEIELNALFNEERGAGNRRSVTIRPR